jgi:hypothetical protein
MKIEVEKFGDGRSLKVLVRFEDTSNFWSEGSTWVPRLDEVEIIREVLLAINEANILKRTLNKKL